MYLPLPFVRNRLPNRAVPAAASSMVARFARSAAFAALILSFIPDIGLAQSLPQRFQFLEQRVLANGANCRVLTEVSIQGEFVLVAPLKRDCTGETDEFSADEGYLFPLNGKNQYARQCQIPKGEDPLRSCSDGEQTTVRGFIATEPLRVESNISRSTQWDGTRLVVVLTDLESRYTKAGGSGRKVQKLNKSFHLEFSFSDGQCILQKINRSRLANGRNENIVSVKPLACTVMR